MRPDFIADQLYPRQSCKCGRWLGASSVSIALVFCHFMVVACQSVRHSSASDSPTDPAMQSGLNTWDASRSKQNLAGYFVAVPADLRSPTVGQFYKQLYRAVDNLSRKRARKEGRLSTYLTELKETGYTTIYSQNDEIECDLRKCLVKLSSRLIVGEDTLAQQLIEVASETGIKPKKVGDLEHFLFGNVDGPHIACEHGLTKSEGKYRCHFNLDYGLSQSSAHLPIISEPDRGKLASCAMAPGTVRDAEEAKTQLEKGGLLALTIGVSPAAATVGYLRYANIRGGFELIDMYLCGDLSHDHFQIDSEWRKPSQWIKSSLIRGTSADAALLIMEPRLLDDTTGDALVELKFKLVSSSSENGEVFGADKFYVRFKQSWLTR